MTIVIAPIPAIATIHAATFAAIPDAMALHGVTRAATEAVTDAVPAEAMVAGTVVVVGEGMVVAAGIADR